MMDGGWTKEVLPLLPPRLRRAAAALEGMELEEIRIRVNAPIQLLGGGNEWSLDADGLCAMEESRLLVTRQECAALLDGIAQHSVYAFENELKRGCITLPGGCRVGLGGKAAEGGERAYSCTSFNIRISREAHGCAEALLPFITQGGEVKSLLLLSPPARGKTTMLRECARRLSGLGHKVCLADDRAELSGSDGGVPLCDVGMRTDVLTGCSKKHAVELALRVLSPEVIVTDEIVTAEDAGALIQASGAGVAVLASAHAAGIADVKLRPALGRLLEDGVFSVFAVLERPGRLEGVYGRDMKRLRGDLYEACRIARAGGGLRVAGL